MPLEHAVNSVGTSAGGVPCARGVLMHADAAGSRCDVADNSTVASVRIHFKKNGGGDTFTGGHDTGEYVCLNISGCDTGSNCTGSTIQEIEAVF